MAREGRAEAGGGQAASRRAAARPGDGRRER